MAADRHFEKKKIAINQPLFEISSPNLVVAMDCSQRSLKSFFTYDKIRDGDLITIVINSNFGPILHRF